MLALSHRACVVSVMFSSYACCKKYDRDKWLLLMLGRPGHCFLVKGEEKKERRGGCGWGGLRQDSFDQLQPVLLQHSLCACSLMSTLGVGPQQSLAL